jgi:CubicO group peptidase (beta-lactamase class C family)
MPRRSPLAFALLPLCAATALGADAIDDYLRREMELRTIPGLALAVVRGEAIEQRFYGLANAETAAPVGEESVFAIASLDKQLTAAGVVQLVALGRVSLDDPLARWIEGLPEGIALRHLLSHTAGLPDAVAGGFEGRGFTDYTTDQLFATVRGLPLLAPPGERFLYSDAGLFLAQLATERIAGEPWWQFVRRELFAPAGMTSVVSLAPAALVPGRVAPYTFDGEGRLVRDRRLDVDYGPLYSDLGTTVGDFARWLAALDRGAPLAPASVAAMATPTRLADGRAAGELFQWSRYGLGVGLDDLLGEEIVLHSGHSGVGFVRFPRRRLSIVVFTNLEHPMGSDPVGLAIAVAGLVEPTLSLAARGEIDGDAALVERFAAAYGELLAGRPDLDRYAPAYRVTAWDGGGGLAGRAARFGALERFALLRDAPLDGERSLLFRATHARATVYLRLSLDADGKITRGVWWHL